MENLSRAVWRKSSRSGGNNGACVEVGGMPTVVGIRDTKNRHGGTLIVGPVAFGSFVAAIKDGRLH